MNELVNRALINLELTRDLYVYDSTDEKTASAAAQLRTAGYQNVAELEVVWLPGRRLAIR